MGKRGTLIPSASYDQTAMGTIPIRLVSYYEFNLTYHICNQLKIRSKYLSHVKHINHNFESMPVRKILANILDPNYTLTKIFRSKTNFRSE